MPTTETTRRYGGCRVCCRALRLVRGKVPGHLKPMTFRRCPGSGTAPVTAAGRCRVCGCTAVDCRRCVERTGLPCHWAEIDLCSACVPGAAGDPYQEWLDAGGEG